MKNPIISRFSRVAILTFMVGILIVGNGVFSTAFAAKCAVHGALPDKACTPGAVFQVTAAQVCKSGYSKSVRNVSKSTKNNVYAAYGIKVHTGATYEMDHFIPLELGGSNDVKNLFPEAAKPTPGFHEKDKVENYLHAQVCSGKMSLSAAQKAISTNWLSVYKTINKPTVKAKVVKPKATPKPTVKPRATPTPEPTAEPTPEPSYTSSSSSSSSSSSTSVPAGASARCNDGTLSYSTTHSGTCSRHGGVAVWY